MLQCWIYSKHQASLIRAQEEKLCPTQFDSHIWMFSLDDWNDAGQTPNNTHDFIQKEADWQIVYSNYFSTFGIINRRHCTVILLSGIHALSVMIMYLARRYVGIKRREYQINVSSWRTMNSGEHEVLHLITNSMTISETMFPSLCLLFVSRSLPAHVCLFICLSAYLMIYRFVPH